MRGGDGERNNERTQARGHVGLDQRHRPALAVVSG
jgi:hypothetical protein